MSLNLPPPTHKVMQFCNSAIIATLLCQFRRIFFLPSKWHNFCRYIITPNITIQAPHGATISNTVRLV